MGEVAPREAAEAERSGARSETKMMALERDLTQRAARDLGILLCEQIL